jgi:hypothetical protein
MRNQGSFEQVRSLLVDLFIPDGRAGARTEEPTIREYSFLVVGRTTHHILEGES